MKEKTRVVMAVLAFALIAGGAFFSARYWQSAREGHIRVAPPVDCDLRVAPCRQALAGGWVTFSISPREIPLMQTLGLLVSTEGVAIDAVVVEIRGLNMAMGLNRTGLIQAGEGLWSGETILPLCSQRAMEWEAAVQLHGKARYEVPFLFYTTRP